MKTSKILTVVLLCLYLLKGQGNEGGFTEILPPVSEKLDFHGIGGD